MTATLNVVVSINSTTVMQTYWSAPSSKLASASPTLCLADGAARAKGGRTLRHSRPGLQNYSVGRFLRFLLSFTACPSPTLCLADGAARAKGGRTLRHSRPGLQNYSVGRFLRFLLSFTACPSPTFCSIRARAFNGRPNKVIKPCASLWL